MKNKTGFFVEVWLDESAEDIISSEAVASNIEPEAVVSTVVNEACVGLVEDLKKGLSRSELISITTEGGHEVGVIVSMKNYNIKVLIVEPETVTTLISNITFANMDKFSYDMDRIIFEIDI